MHLKIFKPFRYSRYCRYTFSNAIILKLKYKKSKKFLNES